MRFMRTSLADLMPNQDMIYLHPTIFPLIFMNLEEVKLSRNRRSSGLHRQDSSHTVKYHILFSYSSALAAAHVYVGLVAPSI